MGVSEFIQYMVSAGQKADRGFEVSLEPDESARELRNQRNDLMVELERARDRIETLEEQVYYTERAELRRYVEDNPGASYDELLDHMQRTVPDRLPEYIEAGDLYVDPTPDGDDGFFVSAEDSTDLWGDKR